MGQKYLFFILIFKLSDNICAVLSINEQVLPNYCYENEIYVLNFVVECNFPKTIFPLKRKFSYECPIGREPGAYPEIMLGIF